MKILTPEQTAELLPYEPLAQALADILKTMRAGEASAPERLHQSLEGGGVLLVMPASDRTMAVIKTLSVHVANGQIGLPVIQGEVLALNAKNGERLGLLDGQVVTSRRTAALSLLAAKHLSPPSQREPVMLLFGAGVQAQAHLEAFRQELGVRKVYIVTRSGTSAERLATQAISRGMDATALPPLGETPEKNLRNLLAEARYIVMATTSTAPLFSNETAEAVQNDAFTAAIGAFSPVMAELPAGLLAKGRVYVDTLEATRAEAGDLIRAGQDWSQVTALADALDAPRPEAGPVVFKAVGHALFDLAAARLAFG
ncbi:MAG: delta(1)-pyrroline-2-carboxylate reductase family protein [Desulfovibrionaceae bacterium]